MSRMLKLEDLEPYGEDTPPLPAPPSRPHQSTDLKEIEDALRVLNPDMPYEDWIRMGMALRHALGEGGFALWRDWSSRGSKYTHEKELRTHWKSFFKEQRGRAVTIRTLFQMAHQAGWRPSRAYELVSSTHASVPLPLNPPDQEEEVEETLEEEEDDLTPYDVLKSLTDADPLDPPSLVKSVFEGIEHRAIVPQPWISLGASIAFVGFMLRKRVGLSALRTNFYVLSVGEAGSGKNNAVRCLQELGVFCGFKKMMKSRVSSIQGLEAHLGRNLGYGFLIQDEAMHIIAAQKAKNLQGFESPIPRAILELFNVPPLYSGGLTKDEESITLEFPFLSLYQTCTPQLYKVLAPEDLSTGLLRRYLVFECIDPVFRLDDIPESFPSRLKSYLDAFVQTEGGDIKQAIVLPEAFEHLQKFRHKANELTQIYSTHPGVSLISTLMEHVKKLSLLGAAPPRWEITRPTLLWAMAVALESFKVLWRLACGGIARNTWETKFIEIQEKIIKLSKKSRDDGWFRKRELLVGAKNFRDKDLQEILKRLEETGEIHIKPDPKKSNSTFVRAKPQKKGKAPL